MNIQAINLFFSYFSYSADFKKKKLDLPEITYKRYSISIFLSVSLTKFYGKRTNDWRNIAENSKKISNIRVEI